MQARRSLAIVTAGIATAALITWSFWPAPVQVDLVSAHRAPMQVTIAAEGVTRVRDSYLVTAPLSGTTARSPVQVGDTVVQDETVVAVIQPAAPAFLDARARLQAEAAVTEAEAAIRRAEANLSRAETSLAHAQNDYQRNKELAARGVVAQRMLDDAEMALTAALAEVAAARSEADLQRAALLRAQAQLLGPQTGTGASGDCCFDVKAPQSGTVLSVENHSARLVLAGLPLLTIGDLQDLEIEVDLLSADAVRIAPGALAEVDRWGGEGLLQARVRRVDPSAFTKVSALGIEEQRVRVRLDILTPPDRRIGLGDNFRVFVRIAEWAEADVLQVPVSALFRQDGNWAVFRQVDGRAALTPVEVGRQTGTDAQILSGLAEGAAVVAFPGNKVDNGVRLTARPDG